MKPDIGTETAATADVIRTPDQRLRVFVSSTLGELAEERAAVRRGIEQVRLVPVMFELGSHAHAPRELYRAYLEQSHIFVGVYATRYGWVAPDAKVSGIEDEYNLSAGKPCLIYIKSPAPEREARMQQFLDRVKTEDRVSYRRFETPEELAALVADDLAVLLTERFEATRLRPSERTTPAARATVPMPLTSLVGRDPDIDAICALLARSDVRLVTLTGAGGIGKTRLAIEAAERSRDTFPDGAVFVDLSAITSPSLVATTVATALGIPEEGSVPPTDAIIDRLGTSRTLLVLDNFERVRDAAPVVTTVLSGCPGTTALITSRALLRVRGEHEYSVTSLMTPSAAEQLDVSDLTEWPAVTLFVERAQESQASFVLNQANAADVAELCRRLDGIPLAIELAAARVRLLPPRVLLARIADRLDFLAELADLPPRQRTLRTTLDWSHELLDEQEQALFARLSVFAGGFTVDAAQAVCSSDDLPDVLETLASLLAKSMVVSQPVPGAEPRFRMLDTVREYAGARLERRGESEAIERRCAEYYVHFAENAERGLVSEKHHEWLEILDSEVDNIRAVTAQAVARGDPATAMRVQEAVAIHTHVRGGLGWLRPIAEAAYAASESLDPALRADVLYAVGGCRMVAGDDEEALPVLRELVGLCRRRGDVMGVARAAVLLGAALPVEAADEARALLEEATATYRHSGDPYSLAESLTQLGCLAARDGDVETAERVHREMLHYAQIASSDEVRGRAYFNLGTDALARGDVDAARDQLAESLDLFHTTRSLDGLAYSLDGMAGVAAKQNRPEAAARLLGAATAMRDLIGTKRVWPLIRARTDAIYAAVRAALGADRFEAAMSAGRRLRSDDAVEYALLVTAEPGGAHAQQSLVA